MKRIIILAVLLTMCFTLFSCSREDVITETTEETVLEVQAQTEESAQIKTTTEEVAQTTQVPTTQAPVEKETELAPLTKREKWKSLYVNELNVLDRSNYEGFCLIEIDGDGVPELYVASLSHIVESKLYWVYNDQLCQMGISMDGLSYIKGENRFLSSGGFQGACYDKVLSFNKGSVKTLASGRTSLMSEEPLYEWNGVRMSASEYESAKNAAFNPSKATIPYAEYSYTDICKQINEW